RRSPKAVDDADVVGDAFVKLIGITHLPGAHHLGNEVVDLLLIGKTHLVGIRCRRWGWLGGGVLLFLLGGGGSGQRQAEAEGEKKKEAARKKAAGEGNHGLAFHARLLLRCVSRRKFARKMRRDEFV